MLLKIKTRIDRGLVRGNAKGLLIVPVALLDVMLQHF